jgi:hypothetical protein
MEIVFVEKQNCLVAELKSDTVEINDAQDALEMMMNCVYQGADRLIVFEHNLNPAFFDLKTKVAGDILQKFSTYNTFLAIVGDFSNYPGQSLKDFIFESNKTGRINFVKTRDEAEAALRKSKK